MKQRLIYWLNLLALISLTAYFSRSSTLNAQNNSKAIEITDQNGKPTILYEESHALVIWAGKYKHWSRLNNVEVEAKQVVSTLEQRGFKVTTVGNPTGDELRNAIKNFIDNYGYKADNRLVIFFSGHGHTRNRTKGYLVPVDAPDPTSRRNEQDFLRVALPMTQIITWAKLIESKHALFVFDSCFSGTLFKTKARPRPENAYIRDVIGKPVRQFITAGDADQEVPAQSVFTPLFIRGLNGEADLTGDGYVTGSELGLYLTQTLSEYTSDQTPQYGKIRDIQLDRGDIVFRSLDEPKERIPSPDSLDREETRSSPRIPLISKATGVNYTPLRNLLAVAKWKEADIATTRLMLQVANRENEEFLRTEEVNNFSCEDLRIINKLWHDHSQGKFGFSVQQDIYKRLTGTIEDRESIFAERVGWLKEETWLEYEDYTFNLDAVKGHLPAFVQLLHEDLFVDVFLARTKTCNLIQ